MGIEILVVLSKNMEIQILRCFWEALSLRLFLLKLEVLRILQGSRQGSLTDFREPS